MRSAMKLLAVTLACCLVPAAAQAAPGPPPPTSPSGKTVNLVAAGLAVPTSFAFGKGSVFEGDGGSEDGKTPGGVFLLEGGKAARLAGSPAFVAGLAWHKGALYVSGGTPTGPASGIFTIQKWSGWDGTKFASQKAIFTAPSGFDGFNGIAFGPDNRLYVGVNLGLFGKHDHGPATTPFEYSILSMKADGSDLEQFATGIRQPWQLAFAPGSKNPLVSALGQDAGAKNPPDFVLKVRRGDNYGFPHCNGTVAASCKGFAKPFKVFSPHTDIMGMAIIGKTLYMTSFTGTTGKGAGEVFSMPLKGGKLTPVVTGFIAPTVGLGVNGKTLYVGELTGQVFSVNP